jgi:hypothetical protein
MVGMRTRGELSDRLAQHYRKQGWPVDVDDEGIVHASGPGGVTWIGTPVTSEDLDSDGLEERLVDLAAQRMPGGGELCPLELLPARECEPALRALLDRAGLSRERHVAVYSLPA